MRPPSLERRPFLEKRGPTYSGDSETHIGGMGMGMGMEMEMGVIIGDPASSARRGSHSGERIDGGGGAAAHRGGGGRGWNPGGRGAQSPPSPE